MIEELDFENLDPAHEMGVTKKLLSESTVSTVPVAATPLQGVAGGPTDYKGRSFDPEVHMVDLEGKPVLSHGNIRIKRGLWGKIKESITGKEEISENPEKTVFPEENQAFEREVPVSDHEFEEEKEAEVRENFREASEHQQILVSARKSANMVFVGGGMVFGPKFQKHRNTYIQPVTDEVAEYERATGNSLDFPPGFSLFLGLSTIVYEIVNKEPECKERYDQIQGAVVGNVKAMIGAKLNIFKRAEAPHEEKEETQ